MIILLLKSRIKKKKKLEIGSNHNKLNLNVMLLTFKLIFAANLISEYLIGISVRVFFIYSNSWEITVLQQSTVKHNSVKQTTSENEVKV